MWTESYRIRRSMDLDDSLAEATEALVRAAQKYKPEKGIPFSAYARKVIWTHFFKLYHQTESWFEQVTYAEINATFCNKSVEFADEDWSVDIKDLFGEDDPMLAMVETLEAVSRFLQKCKPKEQVLFALLLEGFSQEECANELVEREVMQSCTQPAVSYLVKKLTRLFRAELTC